MSNLIFTRENIKKVSIFKIFQSYFKCTVKNEIESTKNKQISRKSYLEYLYRLSDSLLILQFVNRKRNNANIINFFQASAGCGARILFFCSLSFHFYFALGKTLCIHQCFLFYNIFHITEMLGCTIFPFFVTNFDGKFMFILYSRFFFEGTL